MSSDLFTSLISKSANNPSNVAPPIKPVRGSEKAAHNERRQSFEDVLASDTKQKDVERSIPAKEEHPQARDESGSIKPDRRRQQLSNLDDSADSKANISERGDNSLRTMKRSASLDKIGSMIGKGLAAVQKSPTLKILTGQFDGLNPESIPQVVSSSKFITEAMAEDITSFMQKPVPVSEMIEKLGLPQGVIAGAQSIGLDVAEKVDPVDFFKAIGIDPQKIVVELTRLKDTLPTNGLSQYMAQATQLEKLSKPTIADQNISAKSAEVIQKQNLQKKKDELAGAVGNIGNIAPSSDILTASNTVNAKASSAGGEQGSLEYPKPTKASESAGMSMVDFSSTPFEGIATVTVDNTFSIDQSLQDEASVKNIDFSGSGDVTEARNDQLQPEGGLGELIEQEGLTSSLGLLRDSIKNPNEAIDNQRVIAGVRENSPEVSNKVGMEQAPDRLLSFENKLENIEYDGSNNLFERFEASMDSYRSNTLDGPAMKNLPRDMNYLQDQIIRNRMGLESSLKINDLLESSDADVLVKSQDVDSEQHIEETIGRPRFQSDAFVSSNNTVAKNLSSLNVIDEGGEDFLVVTDKPLDEVVSSISEESFDGDADFSEDPRFMKPFTPLENTSHQQSNIHSKANAFSLGEADLKDTEIVKQLSQQIIDRISAMNHGKRSSAVINLTLPEAGELSMAIQVEDNRVNLRIMSNSDRVRALIGSQVGMLGEAMSAQNLHLVDVQTSSNKNFTNLNQQGQQFSQHFNQQSFGERRDGSEGSTPASHGGNIKSTARSLRKIAQNSINAVNIMSATLNSGQLRVMA
ncbi:MAG: flagellar hook-length control protein FliK [Bdellovibrionota bacterium]